MTARDPILLFDGVCNFCNASVNFVIDRDPAGIFRFASLQSPAGQALLSEHGLSGLPLHSMVLISGGHAYRESDAVLRTARHLGGWFALLTPLWLVPRIVRDALYRAFARRRYQLFGKSDSCRVPDPALRARFLDAPRT